MNEPQERARKFMRENLKAIATERRHATPSLMPRTALFLQAASLFAECPNMSDEVSFTEAELHRMCIVYTSENAQ